MSDIFISYGSEDKKKAGLLAKVFEKQDRSVWWDRRIPAGKTFAEVIAEALDSSKCVVVLWSKASITSHWVQTEASEGLNRKILVPALIEEVKIPLEFRRIQAINLVDWKGQKTHPEVNKLIEDVESILGHPRVEKMKPTVIDKTGADQLEHNEKPVIPKLKLRSQPIEGLTEDKVKIMLKDKFFLIPVGMNLLLDFLIIMN